MTHFRVCDFQRARHVRGLPGDLVFVRFRTEDGLHGGFGRRCVAHNAHFRRLRSVSRHLLKRFDLTRSFRFSDEVPH